MMGFNKGDKVKLTERQVYTREFEVGRTATVLTNQEKGSSHISVHYDDDNVEYRMVNVNHIAPVVDKPKFAIGAKVRIVKARKPHKAQHVGKVAVVSDCYPSSACEGQTVVEVQNDDGTHNPFAWFDEELELVVDKPAFAVGDKVRLTECVTYDKTFDVGHVGTIVGMAGDTSYRRVHYEGDTHNWRLVNVEQIEAAPVASTTSQEEGIGRFNGATADGARFEREGERVTVYVGTRKDSVSTTMTLAHFNEVARILNEEAK